jgi:SAM-dependent methyltransferase
MSKNNEELRFGFGENWRDFVRSVTEEQIDEAERSLKTFLVSDGLSGRDFLDIGCGSGLFSLAATRLGAQVTSFDDDPSSVASTRLLKDRFAAGVDGWRVKQGSVLDRGYIEDLGQYDIVYAWGVLHHTGALCRAFYNTHLTVRPGGLLYLAIYNHQGVVSELWRIVKRIYCGGAAGRIGATLLFYALFFISGLVIDVMHLRDPRIRFRDHKRYRGMSLVHDWKDWLGGFPYEPARPDAVVSFYENLGYRLRKLAPPRIKFGNNQFVFYKPEQ